jgi:hypothetical protein
MHAIAQTSDGQLFIYTEKQINIDPSAACRIAVIDDLSIGAAYPIVERITG